MYSYYLAVALFRSLRTYIPGYDAVITPLTSILDHSNHKMEMRGEAHEAFHLILSHLLTKPYWDISGQRDNSTFTSTHH